MEKEEQDETPAGKGVKKPRGRKPGANPFPSIYFAKTVPTVDTVFPRCALSAGFDPSTATHAEFLEVFFGCSIVLDLRIRLDSCAPYYFDPTAAAILHCFALFLKEIPAHFKPAPKPAASDLPAMTAVNPDDSVDNIPNHSDPVQSDYLALEEEVKKLKTYRNDTNVSIESREMETHPMQKWNELKDELPILYPLAAFFLTIPLGSADVERLFSRMRNRLPYNRSQTKAATVGHRAMVAENYSSLKEDLKEVVYNTRVRRIDLNET